MELLLQNLQEKLQKSKSGNKNDISEAKKAIADEAQNIIDENKSDQDKLKLLLSKYCDWLSTNVITPPIAHGFDEYCENRKETSEIYADEIRTAASKIIMTYKK